MRSRKIYVPLALLFCIGLQCGTARRVAGPAVPPTRTPLPTFTATSSPQPPAPTATPGSTPTRVPATHTPTVTLAPTATDIASATTPPTATPVPASNTPQPTDTPQPTPSDTPTPEPVIKYVLADASREFNCDFTSIYGVVSDANNSGIPGVEVHAVGIHETNGLEFVTHTDAEGRYELFHIPLAELLSGQWAVMLVEEGQEVSERFHWASTPVCQSEDSGNSQVLRLDWKLIQ